MSSTELTPGTPDLVRGSIRVRPRSRSDAVGLPLAVGAALLAVILYAAFAHGATSAAAGTRVELAIAGLCAISAVGWAWTGSLRVAAPRPTLVGVILFGGFACWSGVTVLWSVAPAQTWIELNRALAYTLVVVLGIVVGASHRRPLEIAAQGFLAVALAVTVYALGQKLIPGLHIAGLFNLNQTGCAAGEPLRSCPLARLQEPLGYWNALALFIAFAAPVSVAVAADARRGQGVRLGALCAATLMLVTISYTYSRGGLLALAVGLVVALGASGQRLRSLLWTIASILAALPAIVVGLTLHEVTTSAASLSSREQGGAVLVGILALSLVLLVMTARRLFAIEPRIEIDARRARAVRRISLLAAGAVVAAAVLALAVSPRGLPGTISHAWNSFAATHAASNSAPSHLLSADSQNRWVWWKEAAGAFSDRPLGGWGAGSFGVVHLLYRRDILPVQQPHSVPLQFLAETGIIGALLAIGGYLLLINGAAQTLRGLPRGSDRLLAAALLSAAAAYGVHSLYDWDWNIPAVTLPVLLFLGVLAGAGIHLRPRPQALGLQFGSVLLRGLGLAALITCLAAFALSVELPELAAAKASSAIVQAGGTSPRALADAQSDAALAVRLDPLSDEGDLAEATIALHRGRPLAARSDLTEAIRRSPTDENAWGQLWYVDSLLGDARDAFAALRREDDLDPYGASASFARSILAQAPPASSATAIRTPLQRRSK